MPLSEWPTLTADERTVLIFTALFHDAAKPLTTESDPETGRITSPKHAVKVSEHLTRGVLRDLGCDLATREVIARLVRYHGRPAFLLEPEIGVIKFADLITHWRLESAGHEWYDDEGEDTREDALEAVPSSSDARESTILIDGLNAAAIADDPPMAPPGISL